MTEKVNILIVDDRLESLLSLESMLADLGQNIVRSGHGYDALRAALQQDFAVIVIGVDMPWVDGLLTAEVIRRQQESRDVPILFLVDADSAEHQVFRGNSLGSMDYLVRPVPSEILRAKVQVFIELYKLRQDRKRLSSELQRAKHDRDEFLSTLSHELRTPLNAIIGWVQVLRSKRVDEVTMARAMEALERNAKAQANIVQDMLDLSRIITGGLHLDFQLVEFESSIAAAVDAVRPTADAKRVQLNVRMERSGTLIAGDAHRLQQIVWNLLSNSVKFTPAGGAISVQLQRDDTHLRLSVSDTGRGIDPRFLPFVFDRFRQGDGAVRSHGGLGLGLSIARQLVEMHGGLIEASSEGEGKGATFMVYLPIREILPAAVTANAG
jgi:signal transduction histidine kinase